MLGFFIIIRVQIVRDTIQEDFQSSCLAVN